MDKYSRSLGMISSFSAAFFTALTGVFFVLGEKIVFFQAGLLLSLSVIMMIIAMKAFIDQKKTVFIECAAAFGIIYAALASMVYTVQVFIVLRGTLNPEQLEIVSAAPGNVFFLVDMFSYVALGLATLFMALAVDRSHRAFRTLLGINAAMFIPGFLNPFLPASLWGDASGRYSTLFIVSTVGWCIVFIAISLLSVNYFRKQRSTSISPSKSPVR